jgi:shikimate dehydrogenase
MHLTGLIGDPVAHSLSPVLHNAAFAYLGMDARYELWQAAAEDLAERVVSLRAPHVLGANVTLPHKRAVLALLDQLEPVVETVGAANTIIREQDGTLTGTNTDMPAVLATLREDANYDPRGQSAVILGASGAARAAAVALIAAGVAQLLVVNRTLERAEELLADVLASADADPLLIACTPDAIDHEALGAATLMINATSLGWHGDATPLPATLISSNALVFDMVYRPTQLLRDAEARGARTLGGLGMLVRQAALAFERWTGAAVPLKVMYDAVEEHNRTHV